MSKLKPAGPAAARLVALLGAASVMALMAGAAQAADKQHEVQEVVVTASRTGEQSIQKIPMAVSAINPENADRAGTGGFNDITRVVPSLILQEQAPGVNKIDMRGLTTGGIVNSDVQDRSLVSVYLDDSPISLQGANPDLKIYDLERVEVIRGPQGTLYGAGSMAGTIRLLTQKPNATDTFGSFEASASATDHGGANGNLRGMFNTPIVNDVLAVRATAYLGHDSGFIDNVGAVGKKDANDVDTKQGRLALRYTPNDRLTVDASVTYEWLITGGLNNAYNGLKPYTYSSNSAEYSKDNFLLYNLTAAYDLGWADLTSSTSYTDRHTGYRLGPEKTIAYFFESYGGYIGPNPRPAVYDQAATNRLPAENYYINNKIHDFMQEFRIASKGDGALKWNGGVFYERQGRLYVQDIPTPGFDKLSYQNAFYAPFVTSRGTFTKYDSQLVDQAFYPDDVFSGIQHSSEYQVAVFGEGTYNFTPQVALTAGLRYFKWEQKFDLFFSGVYGVDPGDHKPLIVDNKIGADGINPRFALSYTPNDDFMIFAEAAKGFRYGGVNQPVPKQFCAADLAAAGVTDPPQTFGPDSLWSYSVGEKGRFANGRVTLNATAFLVDWSDVQTRLLLGQCSYYFIQNKGAIQSKGLELESVMRITDELTVTANGSYTNATANGDITNLKAKDGDTAPYFPKYIGSLGAVWEHPMSGGTLFVQGNYQYRGEAFNQFSPASTTRRRIPPSTTLNLSAAYQFGTWEVGLFGTNLTNQNKIISIGAKPAYIATWQAGDSVVYARPRTIGVRLKKTF